MASTRNALVILVVFALTACSAFTLQPKLAVAPQPKALRAAATMQFGGGSPERDGITRDNEPEEFFKTNMGARLHPLLGRERRRCSSAAPARRRRHAYRQRAVRCP